MSPQRTPSAENACDTGLDAADNPARSGTASDWRQKETCATLRALSASVGKPVDEIIAQLQRLALGERP
jgi:hypothetical protein